MIRTYLLVFYKLRWLSKRNFRNIGIDPLLPKKYFDILNNFLNIYYSWTFLIYESPVSNFCKLQTLLANPTKLIQIFVRNFNFRGISWTVFWKIHPSIFCEYLFSFCKISGHELDRFLVKIWTSFPEIGLAHAPEICQ